MECMFCGGALIEQKASYVFEDNDHLIYVMNVPTELCEHCDEKSYSPEVSERLYDICVSMLDSTPNMIV